MILAINFFFLNIVFPFFLMFYSVYFQLTAPMLDVIYSSEEKDKVAPFLTTLLYNVFPYLRHHSLHNLPSYKACSQMLASISR